MEEGRTGRGRRRSRRRRLRNRAAPLVVVAVAAFVVGIVIGGSHSDAVRGVVRNYVQAWAGHDFTRMYSLLDAASQAQMNQSQFTARYADAAQTATLRDVSVIRVGEPLNGVVPVSMLARTAIFGALRQTLLVPVDLKSANPTVSFSSTLLFPGLEPGEQLSRDISLPPRASLLARNGTPLAQGPQRTSTIPDVASQIVGSLGPIPAAEQTLYTERGFPPDAKVGIDGLERVFQRKLAGTPGGTLKAGTRALAQTSPKPGPTVKTTIDPTIERAAVAAMGSNSAGIAAMDPRTGAILALAGSAFSDLQPPGSTMKIVTTTGALEAGIVKITDTFPIQTESNVGGFILHNANGEACGGTLLNAFAVSCNSVFAPLGVKLGGPRLVSIAERFGFNQPTNIPGAAEPTIPSASKIGSDTDVGSSAIGQGEVQSTALGMTDVAATIAMGGRRPIPTLLADQPPHFVHVTSSPIAALMQRMMVAVVEFGTGTAAQISGVNVAGKTGTAELGNPNTAGNAVANTDAWFVGYAPVGSPKIVVGALFPNQGGGGAVAAPPVHDVLVAALHTP
jgi:cell division protein FtsI/penicillin-binding protein 2